jgi:hypothetical protein
MQSILRKRKLYAFSSSVFLIRRYISTSQHMPSSRAFGSLPTVMIVIVVTMQLYLFSLISARQKIVKDPHKTAVVHL